MLPSDDDVVAVLETRPLPPWEIAKRIGAGVGATDAERVLSRLAGEGRVTAAAAHFRGDEAAGLVLYFQLP